METQSSVSYFVQVSFTTQKLQLYQFPNLQELRKCFETQDIEMLKETIAGMDPDVAAAHMKRCVASGLWVPDASLAKAQNDAENTDK